MIERDIHESVQRTLYIPDSDIAGERFTAAGLMVLERNYLEIYSMNLGVDVDGERCKRKIYIFRLGSLKFHMEVGFLFAISIVFVVIILMEHGEIN